MQGIRCLEIKNRDIAKKELTQIGCEPWGIQHMAGKSIFRVLKIQNLTPVQGTILKQEMLAKGGEAAVARGVLNHLVPTSNVLLMGTENQYCQVCEKLKLQPFKLKELAATIEKTLDNLNGCKSRQLDCCGKKIELGRRTLVMGILNVTPDSFSDGGRFNDLERALNHAQEMVAAGADIIDIGGESTRPGHEPLSLEEELKRVIPMVEGIAGQIAVPISVDTYKGEVARQALEAGANILNDVWGGRADPEMFKVAASYNAPIVLMHNQNNTQYQDMMFEVLEFLDQAAKDGIKAGIAPEKIILDPGIGFGKTLEQNLELMSRLEEIAVLGYPVLLGTSRKSLIGKTLDLPTEQRVEGTAATVTLGIAKGVDIVRVHDVKEMVQVVKMTDAMVRRG